MAAEDSVKNGIPVDSSNGGARLMENGVNCLPNATGVLPASGDGDSTGLGSRTIRTYKRRKCGAVSLEPKIAQLEKLSCHQLQDQVAKEVGCIGLQKCSCKQFCHSKKSRISLKNGSADYSLLHWKSSLQNMFQSFSADEVEISGIECCIKDALFNDSYFDSAKATKVEGDSPEGQCSMALTDVGKHSTLGSNDPDTPTVTKQCQHALYRLIMSEKFVSLCKLLSENFHGGKFDNILDFRMLNSRMKEGAYEQAPALFLSDIQQLWRKLHVIGIEMVSLSKSLSEMSRLFCPELAVPCVADRQEQDDESPFNACKLCREKPDGRRDCIICDSCEEMFHVSCIKPTVTKILSINWNCANCTALGSGSSPHDNCVICERLDTSHGTNENEESSIITEKKGIQVFKGSCKRVCCKVCKSILENGELFCLCEHNACNHYYHVRCLTNKQLKSYCSKWYCPCCLCRVCLTDKDDDKIVLCDACDHAYHIYCMHPPQKSIPEGQWYCRKCDSGLQAIQKAKLAYKSVEEAKEDSKKVKKRKVTKKGGDRSGGVDMLLSAANAISNQEQLAAICNKD